MPITFTCQNCQARMMVPDHLAGKRGKCSKCKGPVMVPGPAASPDAPAPARPSNGAAGDGHGAVNARGEIVRPTPPPPPPADEPVDVEAAAAAALADEVKEAKKAAFIEFTCPQCDEPVQLALDLGGKKHPCPNCKRIISVPMPRIEERASWRDTGPKLPSAARRDTGPAPEGAWTSQATAVSHESLKEAGVIQAKRKPLTLLQRMRLPLLIAVPLLILAVGGWMVWGWMVRGREKAALDYALSVMRSEQGTAQVGLDGQAALHAAAARYYLHSGKKDSAARADEEFRNALARAQAVRNDEADALLVELLPAELELAGSRDQKDNGTRKLIEEVQKLLAATLRGVQNGEARLEGLRRLTAALIQRGEVERARSITMQVYATPGADQAEALSTLALELLRGDRKDKALDVARLALAPFDVKDKKAKRPELRPAVLAAAIALGLKAPAADKKGGAQEQERVLIGQVAGLARAGKVDEARKLADGDADADVKFRAALEIAAATREKGDADTAVKRLEKVRNRKRLAWPILRLVRLGRKAGLSAEDLAPAAAGSTPLNGWIELELFRDRLAASHATESPETVDKIPDSLARKVARLELAQHNTRRDGGYARTVAGWDDKERAFGSMGVALGMQGGK